MLSSRSFKALILGCTLLVAGCDRQSTPAAQGEASNSARVPSESLSEGATLDRSHKGSALPDLVFEQADGKQLRLPSLKGKPLLINLWATWCAPCIAELPTLDRLAKQGKVTVLTVSQDLQKTEIVAPFLAQRGGTSLEPWLDPDNTLSTHYGVQVLPTTVLYDAKGREVWRVLGPMDWAGAEAARLLREGGV